MRQYYTNYFEGGLPLQQNGINFPTNKKITYNTKNKQNKHKHASTPMSQKKLLGFSLVLPMELGDFSLQCFFFLNHNNMNPKTQNKTNKPNAVSIIALKYPCHSQKPKSYIIFINKSRSFIYSPLCAFKPLQQKPPNTKQINPMHCLS